MVFEFFIIKKKISDIVKRSFKKDGIILDMGCGKKPYYHKAIRSKIVCADICRTNKTHLICDAHSIPLKKSSFDGIICVNSLYYYKDTSQAIKELSIVLKKNGKLVLVTPFIYPIHDIPEDKYRFTEYGLRDILKNYFEIKEIRTIGGIFNLPAVFFHSLIKGIPLLFPKSIRFLSIFPLIVIYPFYIVAQLLSVLDFLDKTRRWPTYYITIAVKK